MLNGVSLFVRAFVTSDNDYEQTQTEFTYFVKTLVYKQQLATLLYDYRRYTEQHQIYQEPNVWKDADSFETMT